MEESLISTSALATTLSLGAESDVKESPVKLPQGLEELYEATYQQIQTEPSPGPEIALQTLMWVLCAFEPCSPDELSNLVFLTLPQEEKRLAGNVLLKLCHGLLTIDRQSDVVQIAHPSVRGFLESRYAPMPAAHALVAKTCLSFLGGPDTLVEIDLDGYASKYPVVFWPLHVQACLDQQEDAVLSEQLMMFLDTHSKDWYNAYADLFDTYRIPDTEERTFDYRMPEPGKTHGVERSMGEILIDSLEELKFDGLTPWHIAAVYGFGEPMEALWALELPNINAVNRHGHTMLFIASSNGSLWIVDRLLKKGADPNVPCAAGMTALDSAAFHGRYEVVQLLLERGGGGARGERGEFGSAALCWAAAKGFYSIVQLLLENGVSPNFRCTYKKWSALYAASSLGRCEVVKLLLENGADADADSGDGGECS